MAHAYYVTDNGVLYYGDRLTATDRRASEAEVASHIASESAALVRSERDARIAATDKLVLPDYPLSADEREAVLAYRQALRDLPDQAGFPWDGGDGVPWPVLDD